MTFSRTQLLTILLGVALAGYTLLGIMLWDGLTSPSIGSFVFAAAAPIVGGLAAFSIGRRIPEQNKNLEIARTSLICAGGASVLCGLVILSGLLAPQTVDFGTYLNFGILLSFVLATALVIAGFRPSITATRATA